GTQGSMCRGACGKACPDSCDQSVVLECLGGERVRRVVSYSCGTHQGCRDHDDCLDQCRMSAQGLDCDTYCHTQAVEIWGMERAASWAMGSGPFDPAPIRFEYTVHAPDALEPALRCPKGSRLACRDGIGRCLSASGGAVEPVFDSYPAAGPDA